MTDSPSDERQKDREPIAALAELRQVVPPPALVARVMTAVAAPRPWTAKQMLGRLLRAELRLSIPAAALIVVAVAGMAAWLSRPRPAPRTVAMTISPTSPEAGAPPPILVRFVFEDRRAHQVFVAGSFNEWNPTALSRDGDGDDVRDGLFVATLPLPRGVHEYMFLVDGRWVRDPAVSDSRPDGFGRQNSLLRL